MRNRPTVLYFSAAGREVPDLISGWIEAKEFSLVRYDDREVAEIHAVRSPPNFVIVDADGLTSEGAAFCRNLKSDPYTSIVPVAVVASAHSAADVGAWFDAGADEVITPLFEAREQRGRLYRSQRPSLAVGHGFVQRHQQQDVGALRSGVRPAVYFVV